MIIYLFMSIAAFGVQIYFVFPCKSEISQIKLYSRTHDPMYTYIFDSNHRYFCLFVFVSDLELW